MPSDPAPTMDAGELERFLAESFPDAPPPYLVEAVTPDGVRMRQPVAALRARPGGTVSGPMLMALADSAAWLSILSRIGPVALSVTTSLHIDFLRKPPMADLLAEGRLLKLGKRLAVVSVALTSADDDMGSVDGDGALVAQAQVTYSLPPDRAQAPPR